MTQDRESPTAPGEGEAPAREAEALRIRVRELSTRLERVRLERDESRNLLAQLRHGTPPPAAAPAPTSVAQIPPGKVLVNQEELEDLRRAKRDLVRLLRRLGRPPFGWVLRRRKGYRRLRQRWLREG